MADKKPKAVAKKVEEEIVEPTAEVVAEDTKPTSQAKTTQD